jgi:long-chain acyl-CoA synthetase
MDIPAEDLPLERVLRWERERPGAIFLTQPHDGGQVRDWTWAEALDESRRMASYLRAQGWPPGSRIGILSRNCAWWLMADLAIWMAGHVSVPIYPSLRAQSIRKILEHSGAIACFVGEIDEKETAGISGIPGISWIGFPNASGAQAEWDALVRSNSPLEGQPVRPASDIATIIYTSGTTGAPKGVLHRFGSFAWNARILTSLLGLSDDHRVLSYLPLAHIVERSAVETLGFTLGWRLFFTEGIETFLNDLRRARPTLFLSVPRLLIKFQQGVFAKVPKHKLETLLRVPAINHLVKRRILAELGLDTVRFAACGAAPLPIEVLLWYRKLGLDLMEGYGMTETMITHLPHPSKVRPGYVGAPLEGVETRLGPNNELEVRSPMNMAGYYCEPQLTAEAFTEDGFFKTGDIVTVEADGQTRIVGRTREQFKTSKGKYVVPAPIESRLMDYPGVEACCLMGTGQPNPFAVVMLADAVREKCVDPQERASVENSLRGLMESVNRELDPFERLSMIVVVDGPWTVANGLLTPTLKIRRGSLETRYLWRVEEWREQHRPIVWESLAGAGYVDGGAGTSMEQGEAPSTHSR